MKKYFIKLSLFLLFGIYIHGQSPVSETYMNPVIPGDHPDPTLTRIGNDFYTTGSSFNTTPKIYHSTDLVHWEVISQPVPASWSLYGDQPAGGIWGGHMVYHDTMYWHFFGRAGTMYFVKADDPKGPWSSPTSIRVPAGVPGLGQDNSIFIDDNNRWYLLVKNGQSGNWILELGADGQPSGDVHDFTWINPAPLYPYSWAEGPVMWKKDGFYYYSFARNVGGGQYIMRSEDLTGDKDYWWAIEDFFETIPNPNEILFRNPNHCSPAIILDDGTSWIFSQAYSQGNLEWHGQGGRQGLLNRVRYDPDGNAEAIYPSNGPVTAPNLPSSGIPWMVPHSDFFDTDKLNPEWSFLGYTPENTHSLTDHPGWFRLSPKGKENTIIKNDAEHNYSLITRLDFNPQSKTDEAGLWIFNGLQTLHAKLYSTMNDSGEIVINFSFTGGSHYEAENTIGNVLWLKLYRENHMLTAFFSSDGIDWIQVGQAIDVASMDRNQPDYNGWIGSQQGLYVKGRSADFDLYIYRDAYSRIFAQPAANQYGTLRVVNGTAPAYLDSIHNNDWALYAGVEIGNNEYVKKPDSLTFTASCAASGGVIEVWLDSLDSENKIAECLISNTGDWNTYNTFTTNILQPVSGNHDVYLIFKGNGIDKLFIIQWLTFLTNNSGTSIDESRSNQLPQKLILEQNYPNPFNPMTRINYSIPESGNISLKVYNIFGEEIATLFEGSRQKGNYNAIFDGTNYASGIYLYRLIENNYVETKKLVLLK